MESIPRVIKGTELATQRLAFKGLLSGLGLLIAWLSVLVIGVIALAIAGFWHPTHELASALTSAAAAPLALGQGALSTLLLALVAIVSFGYWCRNQASSGDSYNPVIRLLSTVWRLLRLTFSSLLPARRLSPLLAGRALPLYLPERTLASTPVGSSGALPLLE